MKKATITVLVSGLLFINGIKAQTLQEGINHLYADRFKSAVAVFEKLLAVNPNNMEATYWLGQTYFDMDTNSLARQLYEKALASNGNAPLILVGLGHADLLANKTSDARQRFEAALIASRGKKGDDPEILYAIGRANVDAKAGDLPYAIEKLEAAVLKDPKNPEVYLQLGNAYRKARPGEGGGQAYTNYKKALEVNPNFAIASLRLAKLFESQKNWELVLQYLNDAVKEDPQFAPAYYELFYYYFFREKYAEAEEQLKKYVTVTDDPIQNDYLYAQLCYGNKDYNCAITKATSVMNATGLQTKPKVYKLLAYANYDQTDPFWNNRNRALTEKDTLRAKRSEDSASALLRDAKKYIDLYFGKEKPESIIVKDFQLLANIESRTGGTPDEIYNTFIRGSTLDTVLQSRIDFLKQGAEYFKSKGDSASRLKEGDLRIAIIKLKPNPSQRDYFDAGFAYYQGKDLRRADSIFSFYSQKWPDEVFGWQMEFSIQRAIDTSMALGLAVEPGIKYLEILEKDTAKNKKTIIGVAGYLAQYYANIAKDKEKAIIYLEKLVLLDPLNDSFKKYLEDMKKPAPKTSTSPRTNGSPKPNEPRPSPMAGATLKNNIKKT